MSRMRCSWSRPSDCRTRSPYSPQTIKAPGTTTYPVQPPPSFSVCLSQMSLCSSIYLVLAGLQLGRSLHCFGVTDFVLTFPAETLISSLSDPSPVVCLDALTVGSVPVKPPSNFVFFQASETGDLDTVQRCLQRGVDVDAKGVDNWRALHFAARKGHLAVVTYLLRQGADADACTKNGWTALHLAAFQAKLSIIDVLLACEANVNPQENQGRTPLDICGDSEAKHKEAAAERLAFYGGLVSADLPKPSEEAAEIDTDATKEKETEHAQESTGNKPADPSAKQEQPEAT